MSPEVHVPEEAVLGGAVLLSNYAYRTLSESEQANLRCEADAALRGGVALVVAAELERLLGIAFPDEDSDYHYGCEQLLDLVRDRAAELRGEGKDSHE